MSIMRVRMGNRSLQKYRVIHEALGNCIPTWQAENVYRCGTKAARYQLPRVKEQENHRLGANQIDEMMKAIVKQCIDKGLIKSNTLIMDSTHSLASSQKQRPLEVLRDASKRLFRTVII